MMNNVPLPMKSPAGRTPQKAYKHVKFMPLAHVRRVVDIRDNEGKQCFAGFPMFSASDKPHLCVVCDWCSRRLQDISASSVLNLQCEESPGTWTCF